MTRKRTPAEPSAKAAQDDASDAGFVGTVAGWMPFVRRFLEGVMPTAEGGPPPAVRAARTSMITALCAVLGLLVGSAVGLVLSLVMLHVEGIPAIVAGFCVGAFVGAMATVILASRFPFLRKGGGIAILVSPILLLLAPFLMLWGAALLMRRGGKKKG